MCVADKNRNWTSLVEGTQMKKYDSDEAEKFAGRTRRNITDFYVYKSLSRDMMTIVQRQPHVL